MVVIKNRILVSGAEERVQAVAELVSFLPLPFEVKYPRNPRRLPADSLNEVITTPAERLWHQ